MATTFTPLAGATPAAQDPATVSRFSLAAGAGQTALVSLIGLTALLVFAYWQVFEEVAVEWSQPQYSHGWIIPLIALFILWARRPDQAIAPADAEKFWTYAKPIAIASGIAGAIGYFQHIAFLSGAGLAGVCLVGMAACLFGQSFSSPSMGSDNSDGASTGLLIVTGVTTLIIVAAIATRFLGNYLPVLHPGYYQVFGLAALCVGGWIIALQAGPNTKFGAAEVIFGVTVVLLSIACWVYSTGVDMIPLKRFTFITALFGLFTLVGGLKLIRWAGPAIGFAVFMFPLPSLAESAILRPLQAIAVRGSEVVFTVIGCEVIRQGNTLSVEGIPMEIIEACSGLSMSTILIAMAVAMAITINRPWWDKLVVLLSAIPIALIANIFRIVATGLIWIVADMIWTMDDASAKSFRDELHNWAGIVLMMPFALGLYWLLFKVLSLLTVQEEGLEAQGRNVLGQGEMGRGGAAPIQ